MPTKEEREKYAERDREVCRYFTDGHTQKECAKKFNLSRQNVWRILKRGGAWHPAARSDRTKYVGVVVSDATKRALEEKAEEQGTSVSKLAAEALDNLVKEA